MSSMFHKMKSLKVETRHWIKEKKKVKTKEIIDIEAILQYYNDPVDPLFFSNEYRAWVIYLEGRKNDILKSHEEDIRMNSRATWIKIEDRYLRFFYVHFHSRKMVNSIWNIKYGYGKTNKTQEEIEQAVVKHFKRQFLAQPHPILSLLEYITLLPKMFFVEDNEYMGLVIIGKDFIEVMKVCVKEKSSGSNGWGVELFLHFRELMIPDLLVVVEEARIDGYVSREISATFITMIPKKERLETIANYRLISLYI